MRMRISFGLLALALVAVFAIACDHDAAKAPVPLSRDSLSDVRAAFSAGASGPRVIVFFSSGCAACDTGSRALQKTLETIDGPLTIVGVWEPIFETDPAPTPKLFGNISDKRVHQVWDPDHIMSETAPDYLEVGLEAILPQVHEQIVAMQRDKRR